MGAADADDAFRNFVRVATIVLQEQDRRVPSMLDSVAVLPGRGCISGYSEAALYWLPDHRWNFMPHSNAKQETLLQAGSSVESVPARISREYFWGVP